jgi:uncharacterized protein (TIGR03437 family)
MRALLLSFCLCASLSAQIRDLAATDDGSRLYFSAPYRLTGSAEPGYQKLFRYAGGRFEVFRRLDRQELMGAPYHDTNFYLAERPQVSADGSVVGYTASRTCLGGSHCVAYTLHEAYLAGSPDTMPGAGWLTLSPGGRYALVFVTDALYPGPNPALLDLAANTSVNLAQAGSAIGDGLQAVAASGAVLLHDAAGALIRTAGGSSTRLALAGAPRQARLSADASTVVYEMASTGGEWLLRAYDIAGARDRLLASAAAPPYPTAFSSVFHPVVTRDGKMAAYLAGGQAVVRGTDGSAPQRLTDAPEGVAALTISGSGNMVYAATATSRLLRIDLPGGLVTELSSAVPHLEIVWGTAVPGARLDAAISNAPASALPVLSVSGGHTAPTVAHAGAITSFQVPWEAAEGSSAALTATGNPSPLEEVLELTVSLSNPVFYVAPTPPNTYPPYTLGAGGDFRRLLGAAAPAFAGGVVHLYATGLGAVSPPLATGAVTPPGTLYRAQAPLSCTVGAQPAEVLFAGLAPGGVGVDQLDLRVPPGLTGWQIVVCGGAWGQIPVGVRQAPPHR